MTRVIVDDALRVRLCNFSENLALCDEAGNVVGHFVPMIDVSQWEPASPDVSEEELDRRAHSGAHRYTTLEVLAHLKSLSGREHV